MEGADAGKPSSASSAEDNLKGGARDPRERPDATLVATTEALEGVDLEGARRLPIWRNPLAIGAAGVLATGAIVMAVVLLKPVTVEAPPPGHHGPDVRLHVDSQPSPGPRKTAGAVNAPLVIDATPWGQITDIRDERKQPVSIEQPSYTPIRLSVPVGRYFVTLKSPSGEAKTETVDLTASGATSVFAFGGVDPVDYINKSGG